MRGLIALPKFDDLGLLDGLNNKVAYFILNSLSLEVRFSLILLIVNLSKFLKSSKISSPS